MAGRVAASVHDNRAADCPTDHSQRCVTTCCQSAPTQDGLPLVAAVRLPPPIRLLLLHLLCRLHQPRAACLTQDGLPLVAAVRLPPRICKDVAQLSDAGQQAAKHLQVGVVNDQRALQNGFCARSIRSPYMRLQLQLQCCDVALRPASPTNRTHLWRLHQRTKHRPLAAPWLLQGQLVGGAVPVNGMCPAHFDG